MPYMQLLHIIEFCRVNSLSLRSCLYWQSAYAYASQNFSNYNAQAFEPYILRESFSKIPELFKLVTKQLRLPLKCVLVSRARSLPGGKRPEDRATSVCTLQQKSCAPIKTFSCHMTMKCNQHCAVLTPQSAYTIACGFVVVTSTWHVV